MNPHSDNANIIPLHINSNDVRSEVVMRTAIKEGLGRLPKPIQKVHEVAQTRFKASIQSLFDHVDDALFELADRASSNLEQNVFFESMREVRIQRRAMEKSFVHKIDQNFAVLAGDNVEGYPESSSDFDLDNDDLSLVSKDELEELVAVDSLVSKSLAKNKSALGAVGLRMASLLPLSEDNNPFSPRLLADSFVSVSAKIEVDIKAKLVLFKLFERYVMNELASILNEVNHTLTDQGVAVPSARMSAKPPRFSAPAQRQRMGDEPLSAPHSADSMPAGDSLATGLYATLQSLLNPQQPQASSQANFADPAYSSGDQQDGYSVTEISYGLLSALSQLQQQQLQQAPIANGLQAGEAQLLTADHIQAAIHSATGKELLDDRSQDVIKLVDMLFSYILEDGNLPDPIKLLLSRLQIPFIKVAIADDAFFNKGGHPARRLLNEMATASIGWSGDLDSKKADPLLTKIDTIVTKVLEEFDSNFEIFILLLTDFIAFQEKERRRAMLFEKRAIDAEDGKAKAEIGRQKVDGELYKLIAGKQLPEVFTGFIQGPWSNILFLIYMRQGASSKQWTNALNVAKELVWSVLPVADERHLNKLTNLLPRLDASIKKGLESISYNPAKQSRFIEKFAAYHQSLLDDYHGPARVNVIEESQPQEQQRQQPQSQKTQPQKRQSQESPLNGAQRLEKTVAAPVPPIQQNQTRLLQNEVADKRATEEQVSLATSVPIEPAPVKPVSVKKLSSSDGANHGKEAAPQHVSLKKSIEPQSQTTEQPAMEEPVIDAQYLNLVDNFTVGVWFEKEDQGSTAYRCRLAAIIRGTGKYIFVNRAGVKVAEEARETLAIQLQTGHLKTLDDSMLFDRALESVISNLRKKDR